MDITLEQILERRARVTVELEKHETGVRDAREELGALDTMERRIRAETDSASASSLPLPGVETEPPPTPSPPIPFAQAVREAVQDLGGIEFTVLDVEQVLRKQGKALPAKNPRTRITLELIPMAAKGDLIRTHRGTGKSPHRYRLADAQTMHMAKEGYLRIPPRAH